MIRSSSTDGPYLLSASKVVFFISNSTWVPAGTSVVETLPAVSIGIMPSCCLFGCSSLFAKDGYGCGRLPAAVKCIPLMTPPSHRGLVSSGSAPLRGRCSLFSSPVIYHRDIILTTLKNLKLHYRLILTQNWNYANLPGE